MDDILEQLRSDLLMSQEAQKNSANFHQTLAPSYQVNNQVWLNTCNIKTQRHSKKLNNKWIDIFLVHELVSTRACWLELSTTFQIHLVFHVFMLRQINQQSGPIIGKDVDNLDIYKVESIINSYSLQNQQKFYYMVKWKCWPHIFNTKKLVKHLTNYIEAI